MNFKEEALWHSDEQLVLEPEEVETITLPSTIKTAARALSFVQEVVANEATVYRFNPLTVINVEIEYSGSTFDIDNFTVLFNRDRTIADNTFENTSILNLQGANVDSITITIQNTSEYTLTINSLALYESDDIQVTTIAKVLKEETIQADLIMATSVIVDGLIAEMLQTNLWSRSTLYGHPGDIVNYIMIEGINQKYITSVLGEETEQFHITVNKAGQPVTYYYWYTSITGEDAYKYLTNIDPRVKYPDITEENRNQFRFMVYKPSDEACKLSQEFAYDELNALTPTSVYGAGNPSGKQKGYIYKNSNGFYIMYEQSDGDLIGFVMDESGVHTTGWTDQHCESIHFYNNGVKLKFTGEDEHRFEYVIDSQDVLTGILMDNAYLTTISYTNGNLD